MSRSGGRPLRLLPTMTTAPRTATSIASSIQRCRMHATDDSRSMWLADAVERTGLGTRVIRIARNLWNPDVIRIVAQCDIVIGCMDTVDGRFLLNTLATYYMLPYFDIGIRLDAVRNGPQRGRIREVCG